MGDGLPHRCTALPSRRRARRRPSRCCSSGLRELWPRAPRLGHSTATRSPTGECTRRRGGRRRRHHLSALARWLLLAALREEGEGDRMSLGFGGEASRTVLFHRGARLTIDLRWTMQSEWAEFWPRRARAAGCFLGPSLGCSLGANYVRAQGRLGHFCCLG